MDQNVTIHTLSDNYNTMLRQVPKMSVRDFINGIKKIGEIIPKTDDTKNLFESGFFDDNVLKQLYSLHSGNKESIFPAVTKEMPLPDQQNVMLNKHRACDAFVAIVDDWQNHKLLSMDCADKITEKLEAASFAYERSAHKGVINNGYGKPEIFNSFPVSIEPTDLSPNYNEMADNDDLGIITCIKYQNKDRVPEILKEKKKEISEYISELSGLDESVFLCVGKPYKIDDTHSSCAVISHGTNAVFDIDVAICDALPSDVVVMFEYYPASRKQIETAKEISAKEDELVHYDVAKNDVTQDLNEDLVGKSNDIAISKGFGE